MTRSIDDIYSTIVSLSAQINSLPTGGPERARLELERDRVRSQAAHLSAEGRHPKSVELEIEAIEQRLAQIDAQLITEGYSEKRSGKNLQDPGAYSVTINRLLNEHHADEVKTLTEQLERLRRPGDAEGSGTEASS